MRRRDFITLLGAVAWPLAADAQQAAKLPTIGYLGAGSEAGWSTWTAAFVQRMRELGWIEGRTVAIEYRWAEGRSERFAEISSEFVDLKVDVDCYGGQCGCCRDARHIDNSDRIRNCSGPDWHRHGRFAGATWWQRHRSISSDDRASGQANRVVASTDPEIGSIGGHRKRKLYWRLGRDQ